MATVNTSVAYTYEHPDYQKWIKEWEKCRDCFDGQAAVKSKGVTYLPRLSGQKTEDYEAYKFRALFYSITSKTVSSLVGMVTAKTPELKYPSEMGYIFADQNGVQFYELLTKTLNENILMSRIGLLVDRSPGKKANISTYEAESIKDWAFDDSGNLVWVWLEETITEKAELRQMRTSTVQYRELLLKDGVYVQNLYDSSGTFVKEIPILNTGKPMKFIPFYVINSFGVDFKVVKPNMLDVADINISHYRTSADLENGRHYAGIPTPVVTGAESTQELKLGGSTAWVIPNKDAKAFYMEFKGEGLSSLEHALKEKESQLVSMSARMSSSGNGSEAAETVRLRYMSETASLSSIARAVEAGLNIAYKAVAFMEGFDEKSISIKLDKEFLSSRMSPTEVLKLTDAYLKGGMSVETYVFNMRRGDQIPLDRTNEDEIKSLEEAKANLLSSTSTQ